MKNADYYNPKILATHPSGGGYVGSATCMECHEDIFADHALTAHFNTSAPASPHNILGSFKSGENVVAVGDLEFAMVQQGDTCYQQAREKISGQASPPESMDIVIGSGVKGQSYLTWDGVALFQSQISFYPPENTWINSPGFPNTRLKRPIFDACLKCHVTYAANRDMGGFGNRYHPYQFVYGVDCERCHNPSAKHVVYHRNNPEATTARYMLKLDTLSRQQRLDVCAQCHSGPRDNVVKGNSFSFLSGKILNEYARNFHAFNLDSNLDVHSNQYGLLTKSKCFQLTESMDCSTCHDPHRNQRGDQDHFNNKCLSCHQQPNNSCTGDPSRRQAMHNSCINCHMPESPSRVMSVQLTQDTSDLSQVLVRTHLIGIYEAEE